MTVYRSLVFLGASVLLGWAPDAALTQNMTLEKSAAMSSSAIACAQIRNAVERLQCYDDIFLGANQEFTPDDLATIVTALSNAGWEAKVEYFELSCLFEYTYRRMKSGSYSVNRFVFQLSGIKPESISAGHYYDGMAYLKFDMERGNEVQFSNGPSFDGRFTNRRAYTHMVQEIMKIKTYDLADFLPAFTRAVEHAHTVKTCQ